MFDGAYHASNRPRAYDVDAGSRLLLVKPNASDITSQVTANWLSELHRKVTNKQISLMPTTDKRIDACIAGSGAFAKDDLGPAW